MTLQQPEPSADAQTPSNEPGTSGAKHRILIVEDEKPLSHALSMKLKHEGYEPEIAVNGEEAIAKIRDQRYDVVLLDLIMPVIDGFGVLEEIRNRKLTIPVIILSNLGQDEDRAKAKELGAVDYFVKSNTPIAEIVARVKTVL